MSESLVALAEIPTNNLLPEGSSRPNWRPNRLQAAAIRLYSQGFLRNKTAEVIMHEFWPEEQWNAKLQKVIRRKLQIWEGTQVFRDALWEETVQNLDMDVARIVRGVSVKAQRGDVPAAKFSLELTGRYQSKDQAPTAINISLGQDMPRPVADIEGEIVES
jgi:hypothetical protein